MFFLWVSTLFVHRPEMFCIFPEEQFIKPTLQQKWIFLSTWRSVPTRECKMWRFSNFCDEVWTGNITSLVDLFIFSLHLNPSFSRWCGNMWFPRWDVLSSEPSSFGSVQFNSIQLYLCSAKSQKMSKGTIRLRVYPTNSPRVMTRQHRREKNSIITRLGDHGKLVWQWEKNTTVCCGGPSQ